MAHPVPSHLKLKFSICGLRIVKGELRSSEKRLQKNYSNFSSQSGISFSNFSKLTSYSKFKAISRFFCAFCNIFCAILSQISTFPELAFYPNISRLWGMWRLRKIELKHNKLPILNFPGRWRLLFVISPRTAGVFFRPKSGEVSDRWDRKSWTRTFLSKSNCCL